MNKVITGLLVVFLFLSSSLGADDLAFDSFQAAERAAQQRAQEYERKMKEHLKNVNQKWEQQQRDIGQSGDNPDISNITTSSDSHRSSDNADADKMDQAVQSSLDKLKNKMINSASPSNTGFAGGSAGYQWRVKKVGDKYVLSDSYSQAAFNTGSKNEGPETSGDNIAAEPQIASRSPGSTPPAAPAATPPSSATPRSPSSSSPASGSPRAGSSGSPSSSPGSSPGTDSSSGSESPGSSPEEAAPPAAPSELAPPQLPPPAVRLVIEHPIDFSEEIFTSNASGGSTANYQLERFSIPEDTRVRLSLELADHIDPNNVSMIIIDEEGARPPVTSSRLNNYRHMFRVPSDDKYSASIFISDPSCPGAPQRKIMQVQIPVTPVDFESRTIDGRSTGRSGTTSSSSTMSAPGSSSHVRSTFGQPQQVDLSDLYARPGASLAMSANAGDATAPQGYSDPASSDSYDQSQNASQRDHRQAQAGQQTTADRGSTQTNRQQMGAANRAANTSQEQKQNSRAQQGQQDRASQRNISSGSDSRSSSGASHGNQHAFAPSATSSGSGSSNRTEAKSTTATGSSARRGTRSATHPSERFSTAHSSVDGANVDTTDSTYSAELSNDEQAAGYYYDTEGTLRDALGYAVTSDQARSGVKHEDLSDIYAAKDMIDEDDAFLLAVSVRAPEQNIYQSFNFTSAPHPATKIIPAGTELAFSVVLGKDVDPDSISIRVNNGESEVSGNLNSMGQSFAYSFPQPTNSAKLNIQGRSNKGTFNYSIQIPVE